MIALLGTIVVAVIIIAALQPRHAWRDDGDVRGVVWHTVRIPSALERYTIFRDRNFLREDAGEQRLACKIVLPPSTILQHYRRPQ
jgi:hypothetical protein